MGHKILETKLYRNSGILGLGLQHSKYSSVSKHHSFQGEASNYFSFQEEAYVHVEYSSGDNANTYH